MRRASRIPFRPLETPQRNLKSWLLFKTLLIREWGYVIETARKQKLHGDQHWGKKERSSCVMVVKVRKGQRKIPWKKVCKCPHKKKSVLITARPRAYKTILEEDRSSRNVQEPFSLLTFHTQPMKSQNSQLARSARRGKANHRLLQDPKSSLEVRFFHNIKQASLVAQMVKKKKKKICLQWRRCWFNTGLERSSGEGNGNLL